jgi:hypothetical protein
MLSTMNTKSATLTPMEIIVAHGVEEKEHMSSLV